MKENNTIDYDDKERDLKTELDLDDNAFEPLDEEEGFNDELLKTMNLKMN